MAIHTQTHSAIGADHAVIGGSAYYFLGVNTSGTPLEWQVLRAGSMMYVVYVGSTVTIHNNPGDEELFFFMSNSNTTLGNWSNMPAALTEFANKSDFRIQFDLTFITSCRSTCTLSTAGTAGSFLSVQTSTDNTNWVFLGNVGTSPAVRADSTGLVMTSPWVAIASANRRDVALRLVGSSGDGVTDPVFTRASVQLR